MSREYRVRWQRRGMRPNSRVFQRRGSAMRLLTMLSGDPHAYRCRHEAYAGEPAYCLWTDLANRMDEEGDWRNDGAVTEPPPWVTEPTLEVREVGSWYEPG